MQGSFSDDCLEVFNKLASATQDLDYSESGTDSYDFTRCVRPNGTAYGTGGKCKKGTEAAKQLLNVTPPDGLTNAQRKRSKRRNNELRQEANERKENRARNRNPAFSQKKPIMTNAGTEKWPIMVKTSVSKGGDHRIPGYSTKDTDVYHKGQHYTHTGKSGTIIKTGEPSKEFQTEGERRVYVSNSGKLYED